MRSNVAYARPYTLEEGLVFLREQGKRCRVMAGGTDVATEIRSGAIGDRCLVDVSRLSELKRIQETDDNLIIGAGVTLSEICASESVARGAPALKKAAMAFGSRQIRNMATIGGNVCRASPAGDTLPALYVQDAQLELISSFATRTVPIGDFIQGPGCIALEPGEMLKCIRLRRATGFCMQRFEKVGNRKVLAVSVVNLAALVALNDAGVMEKVGLAWGSVAPTVVRSVRVEAFLTGKALTPETLEQAFPLVQEAISPIDDMRASAAYRRRVAMGLLFRLMDNRQQSN